MFRLLCSTLLLLASGLAAAAPKNVVVIVADDLGRDLGCYGNAVCKTPNLDALAKHGVRFTNAYATCASCSPSRSTIYTGLFTHQNGQYGLQHPPHSQQSHPWVQTIFSLLRRGGYFTGIIGKVHVGPASIYDFQYEAKQGRNVEQMAKLAREFLAKRDGKPFLLVMGHQDPHRAGKGFGNEPFAKDPKEIVYDPDKVTVPFHLPDQPEVRKELAEYYQSASRLDRGVGLLVELLREMHLLDDTLIVFTSDNGIPFPGAKTTLYEPGVHLPFILSCPGHRDGRSNNAFVSFVDIAPTILDWTKVKGPDYKLPGRSLLPILADDNPKGWDTVFGSHQMHEITMYYPMRSITTPRYKLIVNLDHQKAFPFPSDLWASATWQGVRARKDTMMGKRVLADYLQRPKEELYDLASDPMELANLADKSEHKGTLETLRARLRQWQDETNDPWRILYREEDPKFNR
jgi:N-sulfoglucosamine sulfohydrolase